MANGSAPKLWAERLAYPGAASRPSRVLPQASTCPLKTDALRTASGRARFASLDGRVLGAQSVSGSPACYEDFPELSSLTMAFIGVGTCLSSSRTDKLGYTCDKDQYVVQGALLRRVR